MQKLVSILFSLAVATTYIGASLLSHVHHHHGGAVCLEAVLMHDCCDNPEHGGNQEGRTVSHHHGEGEEDCSFNAVMLTLSAQQRQDSASFGQQMPLEAIMPDACIPQPCVQPAEHDALQECSPYRAPYPQPLPLLRAPPHVA